jgi:hypothetical protein
VLLLWGPDDVGVSAHSREVVMPGADLVSGLFQAMLDEERARAELRVALSRQAALLRELRTSGLPLTVVAQRIARARGVVMPIGERLRLAERLRKRVARRTTCPANNVAPHGQAASPTSRLDRVLPPNEKEMVMPKIVKRTVVEEFVDDAEDSERQEDEQGEAEDDDVSEEQSADGPSRSRRRR